MTDFNRTASECSGTVQNRKGWRDEDRNGERERTNDGPGRGGKGLHNPPLFRLHGECIAAGSADKGM